MAPLTRAAILVLTLLCSGLLHAQTDENITEYRIKAAFLFKFGGYVDWPPHAFADPDGKFVIGVLGAGALADDLRSMVAERDIDGRSVEVRKLGDGDSLSGIHVLFVGRSANSSLGAVVERIANQPVLLVTETDDAHSGSAINFVVVNNKVRFDVILASAESRNLKISSRLLGVARNVVNGSS